MNPKATHPQLTEADLDRALGPSSDSILPSSGFALGVMAAIHEEAAAPVPIPFPWKRAVPGFIAVAAAIGLLLAAIPALLRSLAARPAVTIPWHMATPVLVNHGSNATWITASLLLSLAGLLFCHHLIARR